MVSKGSSVKNHLDYSLLIPELENHKITNIKNELKTYDSTNFRTHKGRRTRKINYAGKVFVRRTVVTIDLSLKLPTSAIDRDKYSIENYFSAHPNERAKLRKKYAETIKSIKDIFKILELGNSKITQDAYDGATDLIAECNEKILIEAINIAIDKYLFHSSQEQIRAWEKNWEILIKGLSFSDKVQSFEKLSLILRLFLSDEKSSLTILIKTAIIDALLNLQDEIGVDTVEPFIKRFCSEDRESDEYVRDYAREAITDLSQA